MSFLLLATAAVIAASAAGVLYGRRSGRHQQPADGDAPPAPPSPPKLVVPAGLERAVLTLGDVVAVEAARGASGVREERWLTAVVVAREGADVVGAIFCATEAGADDAIAIFAPPRKDIAWLSRTPLDLGPGFAGLGSELPSALDVAGVTMRRKSRIPVALERAGRGAPSVGDRGVFAEYEATGRAVAVIVQSAGQTLAWTGTRYDAGEYDRMGSGGAA